VTKPAPHRRIAVYAGSFDPLTSGHLQLIERGARLYDRLILAVGSNPNKRYLFSTEQRVGMLESETRGIPGVEVLAFEGLLIDLCRRLEARVILRGLRASTDFDFEFNIGLANRDMAPEIETIFLLADPQHIFISSSLVKEIAFNGGDVSRYVPASVLDALDAIKPASG